MNSWRTISQKKCSIAHSFIHSFFKPCFYRSFMQKFYRALRFYPTCHISYTDLSHDDGAGTIKLRREKTRMTFFSIDKTDGSVEESTRCVERVTNLSFFSCHLPRRGINSITPRSIPVIYPFGWTSFSISFTPLARKLVAFPFDTPAPKGNPIVEAFGRLLACS